MSVVDKVTVAQKDDVTVGVTSLEFLELVLHHPEARRVHFRAHWDEYERWGYLFRDRVFVDHLTPGEYFEYGNSVRALSYNAHHVIIRSCTSVLSIDSKA